MGSKTLVKVRILVSLLLYGLLYLEYLVIYPSRNEGLTMIPLIIVLSIIILVAILIGIESVILDFKSIKNNLLISYFYIFLTVFFLIIMVLPELVYTYCNTIVIFTFLCIIITVHFILLQLQNKKIEMHNLNIYKKSMELLKKDENISNMLYYKYSNYLFRINMIYIFIYSFNSLFLRQLITFSYAIFIICFYYKMKCNIEISKIFEENKLFYEVCYQIVLLVLIFVFAEYLNGLLAVIILSLITLPIRNNISKIIRN